MLYAADLADPLADVRHVVESFRSGHLTLPRLDEILRRIIAPRQFPPQVQVDVLKPGLMPNLRLLT
jgi:hypothetical protein